MPTHGGDLGHHMLQMKGENHKSPMELPPPKRGRRRKRKKKEKEVPTSLFAHRSRQLIQRD
jgi:hypothetical protein